MDYQKLPAQDRERSIRRKPLPNRDLYQELFSLQEIPASTTKKNQLPRRMSPSSISSTTESHMLQQMSPNEPDAISSEWNNPISPRMSRPILRPETGEISTTQNDIPKLFDRLETSREKARLISPHLEVDTDETTTNETNKPYPRVSERLVIGTERKKTRLWDDLWLQKRILIAFAFLFLALGVATLVLHEISRSRDGFSTRIISNHYAWTYGPTALMVIIGALWNQVDWNCKLLAPWEELTRGPRPATRTVLLDYLSALPPVALWYSIRYSHWATAATTLGSMLLSICIILSTSLLILLPTPVVDSNGTVNVPTKFSSISYANHDIATFVMDYWNINNNSQTMPFGVTSNLAFNPPSLLDPVLQQGNYTTRVPGFLSDMNCTILKYSPATQIGNTTSSTVDIPGCSIPFKFGTVDYGDAPGNKVQLYDLEIDTCTTGEPVLGLLVTSWSYHFDANSADGSIWIGQEDAVSGLLCRPYYSIETVEVHFEIDDSKTVSNVHAHAPALTTGSQISGLGIYDIVNATILGLNNARLTGQDSIFFDLLSQLGNISKSEQLLDTKNLLTQANEIFQGLLAQKAYLDYTIPTTDHQTTLVRQYNESRLHTNTPVVIALSSLFITLLLLTTAVVYIRVVTPTVQSPRNILAYAAYLAQNPSLQDCLRSSGSMSEKELTVFLQGCSFHASSDGFIQVSTNATPRDTVSTTKWWLPFSARLEVLLTTILLPLMIIVALEILQRKSDSSHGITKINIGIKTASTLASIIPTTIMTAIKLLVASLAFNIALFTPFSRLIHGNAPARKSLTTEYLHQMPIIRLMAAVKNRQPSVFLATAAIFFAATLNIIVSNLYSVAPYDHPSQFNVSLTDSFNHTWDPANGDNSASISFSLVDQFNMSYPSLIYDELVFPNFTYPATIMNSSTGSTSYETRVAMTLPAYRASLNCSFADPNAINIDTYAFGITDHNIWQTTIDFTMDVPAHCVNGNSSQGLASFNAPTVNWALAYTSTTTAWTWTPFSSAEGQTPGTDPCFTIGFAIALIESNHPTSPKNVSIMACNQIIEEINVDATWILPTMTLDDTKPVIIHENAKHIVNPAASFDLSTILTRLSTFMNPSTEAKGWDAVNVIGFFDPIYQHIAWGVDGIPIQDMIGFSNRTVFFNAVQHTYRRYMAQAINHNMRQTLPPQSWRTVQAQTTSSEGVYRLFQNRDSKIALQVVLGLVSACAFVSMCMAPMRRVLPHNPLTIAGISSLLVGSRLCSSIVISESTQVRSDIELELLIEEYRFGLGWFEAPDDTADMRFGIDIESKPSTNP